jgi:membrane-associated phospholipid phosphatase
MTARTLRNSLAWAVGTVAVCVAVIAVDPWLQARFHQVIPASPVLLSLSKLAEKLLAQPVVAAFVLLYVALTRSQRLLRLATLGGTMVTQGLLVSFLKKVFSRLRPVDALGQTQFTGPQWHHEHNSFPGGHAAAAFALATILSAWHPRWRGAFYAAAVLMALTRMYMDRHFAGDCLVGGVLGFWVARCFLAYVGPASSRTGEVTCNGRNDVT